MAEERLIDDDKDKHGKYKIRVNEDGEEELYLDENTEDDETAFEIPELLEDEEDGSLLTPEQLREREELRAAELERRKAEIAAELQKAREMLAGASFEGALYALETVEEIDDKCGAAAVLKVRALTRDFKDFTSEDIIETAENMQKISSDEDKAEVADVIPELKDRLSGLEKEVAVLEETNENGKAERREIFLKKRAKSGYILGAICVPLIVFIALAAYFGSIMHSVQSLKYVYTMIPFIVLAAASFVAALVALRMFWKNAKLVSLNEKNSSTSVGREYEAKLFEKSAVAAILSALGAGDDIS